MCGGKVQTTRSQKPGRYAREENSKEKNHVKDVHQDKELKVISEIAR
jgi:hypothetical protein